ncbi:MAG: hypothetical protein ACRDDX_13900 [Cellulosilyticaceae bacterium]
MNKRFYFYDTCSILYHSQSANRKKIISFLKDNNAVVMITTTILMELTSDLFKIRSIQMEYIKEIFNSGIKIIVLKEEQIGEVLKAYTTLSNVECNDVLAYGIREMSKAKHKIYDIIKNEPIQNQRKFKGVDKVPTEIYSDFFTTARAQKETQDSLGEELIFLCIIVLSRLPGKQFIYLSDDKKSMPQVIIIQQYIAEYYDAKEFTQLSTAGIVYRLYKSYDVSAQEVLVEILECTTSDNNIGIWCLQEFDINPKRITTTPQKLVQEMVTQDDFKVIL